MVHGRSLLRALTRKQCDTCKVRVPRPHTGYLPHPTYHQHAPSLSQCQCLGVEKGRGGSDGAVAPSDGAVLKSVRPGRATKCRHCGIGRRNATKTVVAVVCLRDSRQQKREARAHTHRPRARNPESIARNPTAQQEQMCYHARRQHRQSAGCDIGAGPTATAWHTEQERTPTHTYHSYYPGSVHNKIGGILEPRNIAGTVCVSHLTRLARNCFHAQILEHQPAQDVVIAVGDHAHGAVVAQCQATWLIEPRFLALPINATRLFVLS